MGHKIFQNDESIKDIPKKVMNFIINYCDIINIDASDFFNSMIMTSLMQLSEYLDDDETDSILKEIGVQ